MELALSTSIAHLVKLDDIGVGGISRELVSGSVEAENEPARRLVLLVLLALPPLHIRARRRDGIIERRRHVDGGLEEK